MTSANNDVNKALAKAIIYARRDEVERLLGDPAVNVNAKVAFCTPLYVACSLRDAETIDLLLKAGANPNIVHDLPPVNEKAGYNVLHALAGWGEPFSIDVQPEQLGDEANMRRCMKLVLDAGARLDLVNMKKRTPLHVAKDAVTVQCLLDAGADPRAMDQAGETLFHTSKSEDVLRILAPRVDINAKAQYRGDTPLLSTLKEPFGSEESKIRLALLFLDLGVDATAVDNLGNGALHHAVTVHRIGDAGLLLLRRLLERNADINAKNLQGQTPLHWSLPGYRPKRHGGRVDSKLLAFLLDAGAEIDAKDEQGQTPLFQAMNSQKTYDPEEKIRVCEQMMPAGARIDTTDLGGLNLLHCAVQAKRTNVRLIRFLVSQGIDPQQTDSKGNTLWHLAMPELAKAPPNPELVSEIVAMAVDPEKPNNDGQSPLHIVAKFHPSAFRSCNSSRDGRWTNADDASFFDRFIGLCSDIDCVDKDGVTPLHIASTFSEYLTLALLEKGADPRKATTEGLTPLHLAARSRQTNTLGILLSWAQATFNDAAVIRIVNKRDRLGRPALYYACASGRIETVQLLLDSGAVIETETYAGSPWDGCTALLDEEKANWRWSPAGVKDLDSEPDAAGVLLSDTLRTKLDLDRGSYHSRFPFTFQRLDEMVDLLAACDDPANGARFIDQAISAAIKKKFDHATECLLRARERLGIREAYTLDEETSARLSKRTEVPPVSENRHGDSLATTLMARQQYSLATTELLRNVESLLAEDKLHSAILWSSRTMLHYLVSGGFAKMLNFVARPEAVHAIRTRADSMPTPLLVEACRGEQWNMNVVMLLVEGKGADVDAMALALDVPGYNVGRQDGGETALHVLARGGHWWQVNEALPYLLDKKAKTEVRDQRGITPLGAALESINGPHFSRKTVETLLQYGADPNSADNRGKTCLSRARGNVDICQLLISYGANDNPPAT